MQSTVVVGYDHMPPSERALLEAAREAAWRGAALTVVTAFQWLTPTPPMTFSPLDMEASVGKSAAEIAEHGADVARSRYPGMTVTAVAEDGPAAATLAAAARSAELLVVGNRGRGGFAGLLLGSVSVRALSDSSVPTMVVRGSERGPRDLVVAAVDVEDPGDTTLEFAFAEASRRGARLEVLNAWDMPWFLEDTQRAVDFDGVFRQAVADRDADLKAVALAWQAGFPDVRVTERVVDGSPAAVLVEASRRADLVVVGAHRRSDGRPGMRVGPVAHSLAHHADCPVVVVPRG
jgi:nucleotide-binding universal stress UspA family protein